MSVDSNSHAHISIFPGFHFHNIDDDEMCQFQMTPDFVACQHRLQIAMLNICVDIINVRGLTASRVSLNAITQVDLG